MALRRRKTIELDGFYPEDQKKKATINYFVKSYTEVQQYYKDLAKLDKKSEKEGETEEVSLGRMELMRAFISSAIQGGLVWDVDLNKEVDFTPDLITDLDLETLVMLSGEVTGTLGK